MKTVTIVYDENPDYGYLMFKDKDAEIVEKALYSAESRGALGTYFTLSDGTTFQMRTDKYLYWTVKEEN